MKQNQTKRNTISPKQAQTIGLLVAGVSILEAADQVGVDASTIHRWRKTPAFRASLNQATGDVLGASVALAVNARYKAVQTLVDELTNPDSTPADRISAAKVILSLPTCPEPSPDECDPVALEERDRRATMDPIELLTQSFNL